MMLDDKHESLKKNRGLVNNVIGTFFVKGGSLIVSLFTLPVYLNYFHDELTLGVWFTIVSVLNWILNFDLGISNGLRNRLTVSLAKGDILESKRFISSAYMTNGLLCIIIVLVFFLINPFVNWNALFNLSSDIVSPSALSRTIVIVFFGIVLQLFLKTITSVLYAIQKSAINNLLSLISSVITLMAVIVIPSGDNDQNMVYMALIHVTAVVLPLVVATIIVFCKGELRECRPTFKYCTLFHSKAVLTLGGTFLIVQLLYMVIMNSNELLITKLCQASDVTEYQIYYKVFSLGATMFSLALTPIWSAVTKAIAEQNHLWISKAYKLLLRISVIAMGCEFLIVGFLQTFVKIWLRDNAITVSISYGIAFALLGSLIMLNSVFSSFANGMGELKTQCWTFFAGAIIKVPIALAFVFISKSWIGVVWSNVLSIGIYCIAQPVVLQKKINCHKKGL